MTLIFFPPCSPSSVLDLKYKSVGTVSYNHRLEGLDTLQRMTKQQPHAVLTWSVLLLSFPLL